MRYYDRKRAIGNIASAMRYVDKRRTLQPFEAFAVGRGARHACLLLPFGSIVSLLTAFFGYDNNRYLAGFVNELPAASDHIIIRGFGLGEVGDGNAVKILVGHVVKILPHL